MSRLLTLCLALLASLVPATALACSCMGTTIETRYERSENVFSAVITSIEFVECERRHPQIECSDWEAGFEVTQQFKGGTPFERISSHVGGASCGTSLTVGEEYLFFMGDTGNTGLCSGTITTTLADGSKNPGVALIEDYVAGRTPDLSSPWHSAEYDGLCSLRTDFPIPSGRDYPFTGGLHAEYRRAEPEQARAELGETGDVGFADLRVWLPIGSDPAGASAQLSIADREFALDWYQ
ncbi:MAG: hypothetical protein R3358_07420, partial [Woeseiaceae bacterium]|nr:hypothetical protein [Woeseiaceae bacterium]